jgi:hypothetical protein
MAPNSMHCGRLSRIGRGSDEPRSGRGLAQSFRGSVALSRGYRRDKAERKMTVRPDNGRCKRATGRTVQFNIVMKPNLKAAVSKAAHKTAYP